MLIRRSLSRLSLVTWALTAFSLSAQNVEPTKEDFVRQASHLDSLLAEGTEYYIPTPISSPSLLELKAQAPSHSLQLLDFYRLGGQDTYTPMRSALLPSLILPRRDKRSSWILSRGKGLRIVVPPNDYLQLGKPQPWDRLPLDLEGLQSTIYPTSQRLLAYLGQGDYDGRSKQGLRRPETLALARPSGGSIERVLTHYTQESKPQSLQLPQERNYEVLKQRHWIPSLESSIQFSQNRVSDNWYKGGASNLNLYMRNYFGLRYVTERVLWNNEIESRLSIYNAEKDSVHRYRIADDLLRLSSNYGIRAWNKVYYTLDAELRTQLLQSYQENKASIQSEFLAPYTINVGLGMKFDYSMVSTKVYGRAFNLSVNVAPISYTYRATTKKHIDLARHGLSEDMLWYQRIGSTVRANWQWKMNMNITWTSRFYFNTSYQHVEAEWENTLDMALTRFFSTRFNLQLRYDDAVRPASGWNKHLQYNELLSFGFNYRL